MECIDSAKFTNHEFKNIRNFQNLYDKQLPQKMRDFKERQRLGVKKVWLFEKLPSLDITHQAKLGESIQRNQQQEQLMLKKILRDNQGQIGIINTPQQQNLALSKEEEQSIMLQGIKPVLKKTINHMGNNVILTFKSIEVQIIDTTMESRPKIMTPVFVPITEVKNLMNLSRQQFEIKLLSSIKYNKESRQFVYQQQSLSNNTMTKQRSASKSPTKHNKFDDKIRQTPKQKINNDKDLPCYLYSSLYVQSLDRDFKVAIRLPSIDYAIPSKHQHFTKTLTVQEFSMFLDCIFQQWEQIVVKLFTQYSKFTETVQNINKPPSLSIQLGQSYNNLTLRTSLLMKQSQQNFLQKQITINTQELQDNTNQDTQIIEITNGNNNNNGNNNFIYYNNQADFTQKRILCHTSQMRGAFDRDGFKGTLKLSSFIIRIQSLSQNNQTDLKYKFVDFDKDWTLFTKFMKRSLKYSLQDQAECRHLIDVVGEVFEEQIEKEQLQKLEVKDLRKCLAQAVKDLKSSYKEKSKNSPQKNKKKPVVGGYMKAQKVSKIINHGQDKYLLSIQFPLANMVLDDEILVKPLNEDDIEYLLSKNFQNWRHYLMNQHYRIELNINNEPLPRIRESLKEEQNSNMEDGVLSETDFRDKYAPKNEEEKQTIAQTRDKLSQWFPI